ncbi:Clp protease N-terminal domain-containing protein [Streptomyces sp. NPDC058086]|uniref:Clp protease N-terminal domain-containing protein n=1 Tax=Streptomyces sp. NPDC058086 TaxID=3346334 RepID=UPI0036E0A1CA
MAIAGARSEHNGSECIGCEDLLIGLAQVGRGVAASVLTEAGFDPAALDAPSGETDSLQHD